MKFPFVSRCSYNALKDRVEILGRITDEQRDDIFELRRERDEALNNYGTTKNFLAAANLQAQDTLAQNMELSRNNATLRRELDELMRSQRILMDTANDAVASLQAEVRKERERTERAVAELQAAKEANGTDAADRNMREADGLRRRIEVLRESIAEVLDNDFDLNEPAETFPEDAADTIADAISSDLSDD